ncbi:phosphatase PAP2 family protein [Micromonospora phytophila]|uniref:vanadium-dependent haloperoxidase n=1 Tax=Micromonospora phytophila TaxID=709888 RepID=UPI00202F1DC8|nr:vanadium-dependent haloperoxidase [Micromonospora phytophila]MCM0675873.1 phosphatase PAP2 family protein [Micromonospora phytophila]
MKTLSSIRKWGVAALTALAVTVPVAAAPTPATAAPASFDHILYWNDVLLKAYRQTGGPPTVLSRAGAMLHIALFDTHTAISHIGTPYLSSGVTREPGATYDLKANLDVAAYNLLQLQLFPNIDFSTDFQKARLDAPNYEPGPGGFSTSIAESVVDNVRLNRANDGSTNNTPYVPSSDPGQWRPTEGVAAASPNWGLVKPFALTSGSQFRPAPPGGYSTPASLLASTDYAAQVADVQSLGAANSTARTDEQTKIAYFWANDLDGTYKPPGQLFKLTQIVAKQRGLSQSANAKLFALVGIAMADAAITAWDAKYQTGIDLWRPVSAIQLAGTDGNPDTEADDNWQPLSNDAGVPFSPPFPAYVSGHATFGGAWAGMMRRYFGTNNVTYTATTEDPHAVGVTRTFNTFTAAAVENARSRVYLGVHYQWDGDNGVAAGDAVAGHVYANRLR